MPIEASVLGSTATNPPAPAAEDGAGGIPDAVLAIPEFSGLLQGKPAAVSIDKNDPSPESALIGENQPALFDAGFGFYPAKDGVTHVMFNTQFIDQAAIEKADAEGALDQVAVPFGELRASFEVAAGRAASEGSAPPTEAAPAAAPEAGGPAQVAPAPPAASLDRKLATARIKNLTGGGPSSGPTPGQGRLLSAISAPTV
jgi:hypothetical protein